MTDWMPFYAAQAGRDPRPTLQRALELRGTTAGFALDLGAGEGSDTRYLLQQGWRVHAVDGADGAGDRIRQNVPPLLRDSLTVEQRSFEDILELPPADLVYAGYALPFCAPVAFPVLWEAIRDAMEPSGWFAGELFGPHDDWAGSTNMNFHDRAAVEQLLAGLETAELLEEDRDGPMVGGTKHWHVFHVIAHAVTSRPSPVE
ncbi:class I SAM-dependent methyltransferase [Parafrigoribacterium mesophilum]|uniref:class I SAM-dependent methyltransferase n=1 Tax=Parafrigoribacterium mesophilum TaxID=433646 RepID=UPI0031FDBD22